MTTEAFGRAEAGTPASARPKEGRRSGSSVVVAGPYPTMPGPEAAAVFAFVRALVDAGDDVVVVSPSPSAAHAVADAGSPSGALRIARLASGKDRLVLRLDAGGLAAHADPPAALPGRLGLAAAVRRARRTEVVLDRVPARVSGRWASLVLARAASVTVATDAERDALVSAGIDVTTVIVDSGPFRGVDAAAARRDTPGASSPAVLAGNAAEIEAEIRRRAALARADRQGGDSGVSEASRALRNVVPLERPTELSRKPGVATIKRTQLRLLGWMFDAVAGHVNRLQQATIDAIDAIDELDDRPRDRFRG